MDRWITDWERGEPDWLPYYTRANAGETLPDPASPLGWTFAWEQGFVPGWVRGMELMGIYREGEFPQQQPASPACSAALYINLSHMRLMTLRLGGSAESADAAWVGARADVPPYVPHPRDDDPELSAKAAAAVAEVFARTSWPEIDEALEKAWGRRAARPDLGAMRDAELVRYARRIQPELEQDWIWHVFASLSASLGPGVLAGLAAAAGAAEVSLDLIAGLGDLESASPAQALWDLSRQVAASRSCPRCSTRVPGRYGARCRTGGPVTSPVRGRVRRGPGQVRLPRPKRVGPAHQVMGGRPDPTAGARGQRAALAGP